MTADWQPGASLLRLQQRARLLGHIRAFFASRQVMEVVTPALGRAGVCDPHLENLQVDDAGTTYFLQTSPEYAMKRLLAAGSGAIYQLGPAFRGGEQGRRHNIEFQMLEWYRPAMSLTALQQEVSALWAGSLGLFEGEPPARPPGTVTYGDLFASHFGINPHRVDWASLGAAAQEQGLSIAHLQDEYPTEAERCRDLLDLLFSEVIEPSLQAATWVTEFPASMAALADCRRDARGDEVADRAEFYWQGCELANAYAELTDADQLRARFDTNNAQRLGRGLPRVAIDEKLLAALASMPACAGVALGVDRLLMLLTGETRLADVISFSGDAL